jgi:hypothetical protein
VVDRRGGQAVCGTRAWFGRFDGGEFEAASAPFPLDHGPDFYAPAAWAGTEDDEIIVTGWNNSWSYARLLPSKTWSGGAHALPRRLNAVRGGQSGWLLRQSPAALPLFGHRSALPSGRHAVRTCSLLTVQGEGRLRLGDLTLHLNGSGVLLERSCAQGPLAGAGFPGRWSAPRSEAPLKWLLDGCVAEMFAEDGSAWMSALTLREASDQLEVGSGLYVTLQVTA